jgi:hypothetical protein
MMMLYKEGILKIPENIMCFYISAACSSAAKFTKIIAINS